MSSDNDKVMTVYVMLLCVCGLLLAGIIGDALARRHVYRECRATGVYQTDDFTLRCSAVKNKEVALAIAKSR